MTNSEQAPTESKTRLPLRKLAIAGLALGIFSLALTACAGGSGTAETEKPPKAASKKTAPAKADPSKPWTSVLELSGKANQRSAVFELKTGVVRVTSDVKGADIFFDVYFLKEGKHSTGQGETPDVSLVEPGVDTSDLTDKPGKYYLDVTSINSEWTVKVEEQR